MKATLDEERLQVLIDHLLGAVIFASAARAAAAEALSLIENCCHEAEAEAEESPVVRLL